MTSQELLDALNRALAMDLRALTQYMWQHVMAIGMESPEIKEIFKEISIEEMKHAESIADRIYYLGGTPTTKPEPINVGGTLKEMLKTNLKAENETIELCREIIRMAIEEEDPVTRLVFEKNLAESEVHAFKFARLLGKK